MPLTEIFRSATWFQRLLACSAFSLAVPFSVASLYFSKHFLRRTFHPDTWRPRENPYLWLPSAFSSGRYQSLSEADSSPYTVRPDRPLSWHRPGRRKLSQRHLEIGYGSLFHNRFARFPTSSWCDSMKLVVG